MTIATFASGCFWSPEIMFGDVDGVQETTVGYMGGHLDNPSYKDVCTATSGHAEVVQITFDPEITSYEALLDLFWGSHDPTQVDRQGPDFGSQYRSAIFCHSPDQIEKAEASRAALEQSGKLRKPIATTIEPAPAYWLAEDFHQKYLEKRMAAAHR